MPDPNQLELTFKVVEKPAPELERRWVSDPDDPYDMVGYYVQAPKEGYVPAVTYTFTPTKRRHELRASDVPMGMDPDDCCID